MYSPFPVEVPVLSVSSTTATSISLSWTSAGSEMDYEVTWTSKECPGDVDEGSNATTDTSYTIEDLREGTNYTITVTASNAVSSANSSSDSQTQEIGISVH